MDEIKNSQAQKPLDKESFVGEILKAGMTYEPSPYDLSQFSGAIDQETLAELPAHIKDYTVSIVDSCRLYLSHPIIADSLVQHGARREWRNTMTQKFGNGFSVFYEQNRLKGNALYALYSWFEDFKNHLNNRSVQSVKLQELREALSKLPDISRYDEQSTEEKRAIVATMDSIALDFLRLVTLPHA